MSYKYYCPICGYEANSRRYFEMRNNENGHECYPENNPDYDKEDGEGDED